MAITSHSEKKYSNGIYVPMSINIINRYTWTIPLIQSIVCEHLIDTWSTTQQAKHWPTHMHCQTKFLSDCELRNWSPVQISTQTNLYKHISVFRIKYLLLLSHSTRNVGSSFMGMLAYKSLLEQSSTIFLLVNFIPASRFNVFLPMFMFQRREKHLFLLLVYNSFQQK